MFKEYVQCTWTDWTGWPFLGQLLLLGTVRISACPGFTVEFAVSEVLYAEGVLGRNVGLIAVHVTIVELLGRANLRNDLISF